MYKPVVYFSPLVRSCADSSDGKQLGPTGSKSDLITSTSGRTLFCPIPISYMRIRTFGPDGERRRALLLENLLALEGRKMVYLQRQQRTGKVLSAHFYGESRHPFCRLPGGTKYSFREPAGDRKIWQHKRLPYGAMNADSGYSYDHQVIDRFVRALFSGVAQSCLANS